MEVKSNVKGWTVEKVADLVTADWNYKKDDEAKAETLRENIKRNGQIENLIIRNFPGGKFEVVNGNHRLMVFRELEYETAVCYNLGDASDTQARRVAIETNETRFESDHVKLAELIKEISQESDIDLEELAMTMPFALEELDAMTKLTDFNWDQFGGEDDPPAPPPPGPDDKIKCPECGHTFKEEK